MAISGNWGRILHIDLDDGRTWVEEPDDEIYLKLIGGRALAAYLLLRDTSPGADALGPDNLLIFAPGVLQGSNLPGSGRHGVAAKSPLTGAIASSEAGGWWGHEFKCSGYDALVIRGRARRPVYIWVNDGDVTLMSAEALWGRDTADVETAIRAELGDGRIRIAQCGVAGENLVRFASIMHDVNRAAGRGGLGAVMGSKNLKAVAVRGTQRPPADDRDRVTGVARWLGANYRELAGWAVEMGTPGSVSALNEIGGLPTRNFQDPDFNAAADIDGVLMHDTILTGRDTCQACPIRCKQIVAYESGSDVPSAMQRNLVDTIDPAYGGPEYETLASLGSCCGVSDLVSVAKANELTARWGLDTISTGLVIAFVMECMERGLLSAEQTGGFEAAWGDPTSLLAAVQLIAHRQGFGDQMAQGTRRLAQWIGNGADEFAMEVKGLELPLHEPRLKFAMGLGYAVAPVGADHQMNIHDTDYMAPGFPLERVNEIHPAEPLAGDDLSAAKMAIFYHEVNWMHFQDCAVMCQFYPYKYSHMAEALSGLTGHEFGVADVLAVGERAQTLARLFNLREGLTAADDRLPKRVMRAFQSGPLAGLEITDQALMAARSHWYGLMGWTAEGVPTPARLAALGLDELLAVPDGAG